MRKLLRQKVIEVQSVRKALSKERDRLCRSENENRKLREKIEYFEYKEEKAVRAEKRKREEREREERMIHEIKLRVRVEEEERMRVKKEMAEKET